MDLQKIREIIGKGLKITREYAVLIPVIFWVFSDPPPFSIRMIILIVIILTLSIVNICRGSTKWHTLTK